MVSPYIYPGLPTRPIQLDDVLTAVCSVFGIEAQTLRDKNRHDEVVVARNCFFHICRLRCQDATLKKLGAYTCKDHTTVIHGLTVFEKDLATMDGLNEKKTLVLDMLKSVRL